MEELRHQIAAAIDGHLSVSVEPVTPEDIARALDYFEKRKAVRIVEGAIADGDPLPSDSPFFDWVNGGATLIAPEELPAFILKLVNRFNNPQPLNTR